jgi:hypothetical protein
LRAMRASSRRSARRASSASATRPLDEHAEDVPPSGRHGAVLRRRAVLPHGAPIELAPRTNDERVRLRPVRPDAVVGVPPTRSSSQPISASRGPSASAAPGWIEGTSGRWALEEALRRCPRSSPSSSSISKEVSGRDRRSRPERRPDCSASRLRDASSARRSAVHCRETIRVPALHDASALKSTWAGGAPVSRRVQASSPSPRRKARGGERLEAVERKLLARETRPIAGAARSAQLFEPKHGRGVSAPVGRPDRVRSSASSSSSVARRLWPARPSSSSWRAASRA